MTSQPELESVGLVRPGIAGTGSPPRAARWSVTTLFFINGVVFASWASRIPAIQAQHGMSHGTLGLALLAMASGAVIAMPTTGFLCAHLGSHRITRISFVTNGLILPCLALAPSVHWLVPIMFCNGISHGMADVSMNAQAVEVERRHPGPIMSSFHALWSTGSLVGAGLGGLLVSLGWQPAKHFALTSVVAGVAGVFALPKLLPIVAPALTDGSSHPLKLRQLLPNRFTLPLGIIAVCVMLGEGAMSDWGALYLRTVRQTSESLAALGFGVFCVAMAAGRFLGDVLAGRFGAAAVVRSGGILSAAGIATALASGSTPVVLTGYAAVGLGFATLVPLVFSAAGRTPGVDPGVALSSVTTLGYCGFLVGPPTIGFLAELAGLGGALSLLIATSLLSAVLAGNLKTTP